MEWQYIIEFGYLAVFIGSILEGETFLLMAALAASYGFLDLGAVILLAYLGSLVGDLIFFFLGRLKGLRFLDKRPHWQVRAGKVFRGLSRHRVKVLFLYRFVYGFRGVTPLVFGLTGMPVWHFFRVVVLTALVWAIITGGVAYLLGDKLKDWGVTFFQVQVWFLVSMGLALLVYLVGNKIWRSSRKKKQRKSKAQAQTISKLRPPPSCARY